MRTLRVWFSKTEEAIYISHLDLQRVMHRALKMSGIPAWYSLGFNPHIYLNFLLPLPLGQESRCEAMDFKTEDDSLIADTVIAGLNGALPHGLRVSAVTVPKLETKDIAYSRYLVSLSEDGLLQNKNAIAAYNAATTALTTKSGKKNGRKTEVSVDLKDYILQIPLSDEKDSLLNLLLPAGSQKNLNPAVLLQYLQNTYQADFSAATICRTEILTKDYAPFA